MDVGRYLVEAHPEGGALGGRVRQDKIEEAGRATLRYDSRLLHIGVGRAHTGTRVLLLVDLDVRIVSEDGELLRQLAIDPGRDYQPLGRPEFLQCLATSVCESRDITQRPRQD